MQIILVSVTYGVDLENGLRSTPPTSPAIALAHSQYRNVLNQSMTVSSCTDIAQVLINEGTQPLAGDANWVSCTTSTGAILYSLATSTEGNHALKAWSKDIHGNVSTTSTDLTVVYDVTLPVINIASIGLLKGDNTVSVNWSATETNIDSSVNFNIEYWNGSSWNVIGTVAATAGPLSSSSFSTSWTTPLLDRTDIQVRVSVTDLAGNSKTQNSNIFEIDSTIPVLTITAPSNSSYFLSSTIFTGTCEVGGTLTFSGDLQASFTVDCTSSPFSQLVNFSDNDGLKTITVVHSDPAGNQSSATRSVYRDETAPVLTKSSGVNPDFTRFDIPNAWVGTCEGTYTISVTGDETTTFACSSGTWSWTPSAKTIDGVYSYNLVQTDAAGNTSAPALNLSWERDGTPPIFFAANPVSISENSTSALTNNLSILNFSGSCEGINSIVISGAATDAISCSSGSWTWSSPEVTTDGLRTYSFVQSDDAGNTTSLTLNWTRDTTGPALTIAQTTVKSNVDTVTFSGGCEDGLSIAITGATSSSTTCNTGIWSWTSPVTTTDATRTYNFAQTNALSNTTTVVGNWIRETNLPTISALSTTASNPTTSANIPITITATSQNSSVYLSHLCVKSNVTTTPATDDTCWQSVNGPSIGIPLAQALNLTGEYFHLLGWTPNIVYSVYAWVMDEAGNISSLTSSGLGTAGVDTFDRIYDPGVPPVVYDVIAANTPLAPNPPTRAESSVPAGSDVFIRWKATDNLALPSGAITLYYTQDEINFTSIVGAESLDAYTNYNCTGLTLAANEGCYKWTGGSPLNTSFKIQVKVTDSTALSVKAISNPLNTDAMKIIAGNTESGLGGAAISAMFFTRKVGAEADPGTLVVTGNGQVYFADYKRGILTVDPMDGKQKIFIAQTGVSSGDGGPAVNATLRYATKIALDYQNRLLILDTDRIRRVNLNEATPSIETIIGGGANTADNVTNPLDLNIYAHSTNSWTAREIPFFATPNGDIYFQSDYGIKEYNKTTYRFRIYKAATGQVISKYITAPAGVGDGFNPTIADVMTCRLHKIGLAFDPATSVITGATVQTYHNTSYPGCDDHSDRYSRMYLDPVTFVARDDLYNDSYRYYRYFHITGMNGKNYVMIDRNYVMEVHFDGTYTKVLGSGTRGHCDDGTPNLSCNMDIQDLFITTDGKFYFTDAGQIRTIDSNGNVVTLFGQHPAYGDGVNALNARFGHITTLQRLNSGKIVVADDYSYYFKEFTVEGNIDVIAGTGNYAQQDTTTLATEQGLYDGAWWAADKNTGDLYVRRAWEGKTYKLNRSTGLYESIIGGGATLYTAADGLSGSSLQSLSNQDISLPLALSADGTKLLLSRMRYNTVDLHYEDYMLKAYDLTNSATQSHVSGTNDPLLTWDGNVSTICASGTSVATCRMPYWDSWGQNAWWDATNNRWILAGRYRIERQIWSFTPGGNAVKLATTARNIDDSALWHNDGSTNYLYYCYGGRIYKHNIDTDQDLGQLTWTMDNLYCRGYSMDYNPTNNSIIFPFEQNGLYGVAEYFLP